MDVQMITNLISSMGFPIVCCVFLWKYVNTTMKEFTDTMNHNTTMIEKLIDRLDLELSLGSIIDKDEE